MRGCVGRSDTAAWQAPSPGPPADMPHVGLFPAHWGILALWLQGALSLVLPALSVPPSFSLLLSGTDAFFFFQAFASLIPSATFQFLLLC